jgi:hypothetical protein
MKTWSKTVVCLLSLVVVSASVEAAYLKKVVGNTRPHAPGGVGSTINFAVLNQAFATYGDSWGTGHDDFNAAFVPGRDAEGYSSGALDRRAQYLYLYQIVNDGQHGVPIKRGAVRLLVDPRNITSWGFFRGLGLADDKDGDGFVTPVSYLNTFGLPAPAQQHSPAVIGVNNPIVLSIGGPEDTGVDPDEVFVLPQTFYAEWKGDRALQVKQRGTLIGFTTDLPPTQDLGIIYPKQ